MPLPAQSFGIWPVSGSLKLNVAIIMICRSELYSAALGIGQRSYAMLVRRITRANDGGVPVLRETQHYEFANGTKLDDTLDVSAASLAPLRYFSADHQGVFDLGVQGTHIDGWRTDSLGVRADVHATTTWPFFGSIMTEGFIAAFPLDMGARINIPVADPPIPLRQVNQ